LFYGCTSLTSVTNNATTPQTINANVFGGVTIKNIPLTVPSGSIDKYKAAPVWKDFFSINEQHTAIETIETDKFTVYPNPAKDEIFIQSEKPIEKVEIIDLSGRVMINSKWSNGQSINVSSLPAGVYLVKIQTSAGVVAGKIVKQ
jgi:hypothetical protein